MDLPNRSGFSATAPIPDAPAIPIPVAEPIPAIPIASAAPMAIIPLVFSASNSLAATVAFSASLSSEPNWLGSVISLSSDCNSVF